MTNHMHVPPCGSTPADPSPPPQSSRTRQTFNAKRNPIMQKQGAPSIFFPPPFPCLLSSPALPCDCCTRPPLLQSSGLAPKRLSQPRNISLPAACNHPLPQLLLHAWQSPAWRAYPKAVHPGTPLKGSCYSYTVLVQCRKLPPLPPRRLPTITLLPRTSEPGSKQARGEGVTTLISGSPQAPPPRPCP